MKLPIYSMAAISSHKLATMTMKQFESWLSLSPAEFLKKFGSEVQSEQALEAVRWAEGFRCARCDCGVCCVLRNVERSVFECSACCHQASLIAGGIFQRTTLPLTSWVPATYLIIQAKPALLALSLRRKLGGERAVRKVEQAADNKVPLFASVSLTEEDRAPRGRRTAIAGLSRDAASIGARDNMAPGSAEFADGFACSGAGTEAPCTHHPKVTAGYGPKDVPKLKWINTVLGNLKTNLSSRFHAFDFQNHVARFLAAYFFRFNLNTLHQRLLIAAVTTIPSPPRSLLLANVRC